MGTFHSIRPRSVVGLIRRSAHLSASLVLLCSVGSAQTRPSEDFTDLQVLSEFLSATLPTEVGQAEYLKLMDDRRPSPSDQRLKAEFATLRVKASQYLETSRFERSPSFQELASFQTLLNSQSKVDKNRRWALGQVLMELASVYFYNQECRLFRKAVLAWDAMSPITLQKDERYNDRRYDRVSLMERNVLDVEGAQIITMYWYANLQFAGHPCAVETNGISDAFYRVAARPTGGQVYEVEDGYQSMARDLVSREKYNQNNFYYDDKWRYFKVTSAGLVDVIPPEKARPYIKSRFKDGAIKLESQMRGWVGEAAKRK